MIDDASSLIVACVRGTEHVHPRTNGRIAFDPIKQGLFTCAQKTNRIVFRATIRLKRAISILAKSSLASFGGSKKFFRRSTGIRLSGCGIEPKSRESVSCDSLHRDQRNALRPANACFEARCTTWFAHHARARDDKNCEADPNWHEVRRRTRLTARASSHIHA
ncbi:MAG: hypothetical protein ABW198_05570 [Pseudorhodoplanes sp.]